MGWVVGSAWKRMLVESIDMDRCFVDSRTLDCSIPSMRCGRLLPGASRLRMIRRVVSNMLWMDTTLLRCCKQIHFQYARQNSTNTSRLPLPVFISTRNTDKTHIPLARASLSKHRVRVTSGFQNKGEVRPAAQPP